MTIPVEKRDPRRMRAMFETIAPRYDFITRAFSYGMDTGWKRRAVTAMRLPANARVLDLAAGTGDFSRLAASAAPGSRAVAADLTFGMLREARRLGVERCVAADALRLPFRESSFDAVFVGYGMRNFPDVAQSLGEIRRVLRPGGALASLDFFLPALPVWRHVYLGYLYAQGAFWGALLHGRPRVYTYIPHSLSRFTTIRDFSRMLEGAGFREVSATSYILGGIAVHQARA